MQNYITKYLLVINDIECDLSMVKTNYKQTWNDFYVGLFKNKDDLFAHKINK